MFAVEVFWTILNNLQKDFFGSWSTTGLIKMTRNKGVQKPLKSKGLFKSNRNRDVPAMSSSCLPNPGDTEELNMEIPSPSNEVPEEVGWKPQWHGDGPMQGEFPYSFVVVLRNRIWKIPDCYYFTDAQHPCECPCFYCQLLYSGSKPAELIPVHEWASLWIADSAILVTE